MHLKNDDLGAWNVVWRNLSTFLLDVQHSCSNFQLIIVLICLSLEQTNKPQNDDMENKNKKDVANETNDICDSSVSKNKIVVTYGQSIHLGCFETVPEILKDQQVAWYHHSKDNGR